MPLAAATDGASPWQEHAVQPALRLPGPSSRGGCRSLRLRAPMTRSPREVCHWRTVDGALVAHAAVG
eukprot:3300753-Lingulodinium_polyedra.AAC.1